MMRSCVQEKPHTNEWDTPVDARFFWGLACTVTNPTILKDADVVRSPAC
jgi:hypothetical protein